MENKNAKEFGIRCRAIILNEGKLFVVRHPKNLDFYSLPGGHLEWGEDIKECLEREIVEELGVTPKIGRLLYVSNFMGGENTQTIEFFFEILNSSDFINNLEEIERTHAHEIAEVCWLSPSDTFTLLPKEFHEDFKKEKILSDEIRYIHSS